MILAGHCWSPSSRCWPVNSAESSQHLIWSLVFYLWLHLRGPPVPPSCTTPVSLTTVPTPLPDGLLSGIVGMMSRLSTDDKTEEEKILGLLSLQVLNEETNGCKEEVKLFPATTTPKKPPKKKTRWNGLRCAYMMITFLFVSYNKGDWCYCHYCNPELDNRNDPCCAF
ncbi:epididymal protein 13 isoform X2 [Camelus ferus]|uniref:Epididymal protein 13 isoform X2 n=1 Tax=Camelus ferus TaxID=419612 RepID=A0A8B8TNV2_CAMFR|nr:epididymal protein 13 isoform X2 [Camelus ferus]